MHEIGHAAGLFHEHQRPDRDTYVEVFPDNVEEGKYAANFELLTEDTVNTYNKSYDYLSIMHYSPTVSWNKRTGGKSERME